MDKIKIGIAGPGTIAKDMHVPVLSSFKDVVMKSAAEVNINKIIRTQVGRMSGDKRPNETYSREDRAFIDSVLDGTEPLVSGGDGLSVLETLEAIKESMNSGKVVEVRRHFKSE